MSVISNGDPPKSLKEYLGALVSRLPSIAELIKIGTEIKEKLGFISGLLVVIALALNIKIPEHVEKAPQPEYHAPFHVPGTQYDGKNDPIVSTPRFGDSLKKPNNTVKIQPTRPPVQLSNAPQSESPAKMSIGMWLQTICPLIFGAPAEADRS